MEIDALRIVSEMVDNTAVPITDDTAAHLIIEVDGNDPDVLMRDMEAIGNLLAQYDIGEIYFAEDATQKDRLWKLRRRAAEAVKLVGYTIEEDTVVPRAELPTLIRELKALGKKHQVDVVCYGHAGDGNLHVRLRKEGMPNSYGNPVIEKILNELFEIVYKLGGTISAEHGIGLIQKGFMPIVFQEKNLELMRAIKKVFDPNNILNAGKVI
jgi:glycolate oxidase